METVEAQNGEARISSERCTHRHIINGSSGPGMRSLTDENCWHSDRRCLNFFGNMCSSWHYQEVAMVWHKLLKGWGLLKLQTKVLGLHWKYVLVLTLSMGRSLNALSVNWSTVEYTRVPESTLKYTRVHWSTPEYTRVHWSTLEYTRVHWSTV